MSQYSIVESVAKISILFLLLLGLSGSAFAQDTYGGITQSSSRVTSQTEPCGSNSFTSNTGCTTAVSDSSKSRSGYESTIASLLARIKALNEQIKNGTTTKSEIKKEIPKEHEQKTPACTPIKLGLNFGSRDNGIGGSVKALQQSLTQSGHYNGDITGYFGEQTRNAVQNFQKENGIASGGDERTTGYGRFGQKTSELLTQKCVKTDTAEVTPKAYTLADVVTITSQRVDPIKRAVDDEFTHYVVTLNDKTTREVKHGFSRITLEERFKKTGYTGDVKALLAKVTVLPPKIAPKKFVIDDIAIITGKSVDPSAGIADDEYIQYTITFKNGATVMVNGHAGRGTERTRALPFRTAGYRGSMDDLLEQVTTPAVLGVSISGTDALLQEFTAEVEFLLSRIE